MDALATTVHEALEEGIDADRVVDVLLDHDVSEEAVRSAWPDGEPCPLHETGQTPTQEDIERLLNNPPVSETGDEEVTVHDVPQPDLSMGRSGGKSQGSVKDRLRSLLGLS